MLKKLLEKANRKCEMQWRAYAYDPEKDNELVKTSDAFDCIDCAMQFKRDYLEKHCNHVVQIVAESKSVKSEAYKIGDKVRITSKGTFGYGDTGIIRAINDDKFTIEFNAPNSGTIKLSAKDITKESAQKNEAKEYKLYKLKKIGEDKVIQDEYPATSMGDALRKRIKLRKKNDGFLWEIYEIENGKRKLIDSTDHYTDEFIKNNFKGDHYRNKESAQKNESIRIKTTFGSGKKSVDANYAKAADAVDVVRRTITDNTDKGTKMTITIESAQKNENAMYMYAFYAIPGSTKKYKTKEDAAKEAGSEFNASKIEKKIDVTKDKNIANKYELIKIVESIKNEDIDDDSTGIVKKDDEKQMTEARGWRVSIKLQSKDNMNNINVEDAIEDALNSAGFTVNDVDAERM